MSDLTPPDATAANATAAGLVRFHVLVRGLVQGVLIPRVHAPRGHPAWRLRLGQKPAGREGGSRLRRSGDRGGGHARLGGARPRARAGGCAHARRRGSPRRTGVPHSLRGRAALLRPAPASAPGRPPLQAIHSCSLHHSSGMRLGPVRQSATAWEAATTRWPDGIHSPRYRRDVQ